LTREKNIQKETNHYTKENNPRFLALVGNFVLFIIENKNTFQLLLILSSTNNLQNEFFLWYLSHLSDLSDDDSDFFEGPGGSYAKEVEKKRWKENEQGEDICSNY